MLGAGLCGSLLQGVCVSCLGGAGIEGQTHFDELHVQLGVLLHVLKQVSMECLHLREARMGVTRVPFDPDPNTFTCYHNAAYLLK